jgi:hypothetical protein
MIDVVYNHTAHDSVLVHEHPDWFHLDENQVPCTTVPAWSDVIDLKHPNENLADYLIETLCYWVELGVDGFRCDVASILPIDFWKKARCRVEKVNPDVIWLAESVHAAFVIERRAAGLRAHSDSELYDAFDLTYDYDIWPIWQAAVRREVPVQRYLEMLMFQRGIYPQGFIKMRCVENHDQPRIMALAPDRISALAWTAFELFNQGAFLIYAGEEAGAEHAPSLFDIDKVNWETDHLSDWFKALTTIKKLPIFHSGELTFIESEPAIQAVWENDSKALYGIFNVGSHDGTVNCPLPDGAYLDLISGERFDVEGHQIEIREIAALIFETEKGLDFSSLTYPLLSFIIC